MSPEQKIQSLAERFAIAKAFGDERARAAALGSLAPYVSTAHYATLLNSLIEAAARLPRGLAVSALFDSMRISAALGGARELVRIRRAISDTAQWYP
jgi:hypothetical protein